MRVSFHCLSKCGSAVVIDQTKDKTNYYEEVRRLSLLLSGERIIKIKDVVRFKTKSVRIRMLCFSSERLGSQGSFNREFVALIRSKVLSTTIPSMI